MDPACLGVGRDLREDLLPYCGDAINACLEIACDAVKHKQLAMSIAYEQGLERNFAISLVAVMLMLAFVIIAYKRLN